MITGLETNDRVLRRTALKAGAVAIGTLGMIAPVSSTEQDDEGDETDEHDDEVTDDDEEENEEGDEETEVDEPEGFSGEVLAPHATFPDDVGARFTISYAEGEMGTVEIDQDDFRSVVVAKVTWQPGGTTGWHTHHAPVIVAIERGDLEVTNELDCVARTYTEGEAFVAQGQENVHRATNLSETECAVAYATYLGVPEGEPPTMWVEPPDC